MRHQKNKDKLGLNKASRKALMINLVESLVLHEKIKTTKPKAKCLRSYAEKLVTKSKNNDLATRRYLIESLFSDNIVKKLLEVIGPRYKDRQGGYTRIIKLDSRRVGDNAEKVIIEFV